MTTRRSTIPHSALKLDESRIQRDYESMGRTLEKVRAWEKQKRSWAAHLGWARRRHEEKW